MDVNQSGNIQSSILAGESAGNCRYLDKGISIILYDGVCGFCNRFTAFVLARDKKNVFRFASLQSTFASEALAKYSTKSTLDTVYVITDAGNGSDRLLCKFEAVIFVLANLQTTAAAGWALKIVPKQIGDMLYNLFARYRYALFGELETCPYPSEAQRSKFID